MTLIYENNFSTRDGLAVHAQDAQLITKQDRAALCIENGLVLIPEAQSADLVMEVSILAEQACYPGLAFRAAGPQDYELAYAQPHTSGSWDALQYNPVMKGSNTWQIFHGLAYQAAAQVPTGRWFRLRIEAFGQQAAVAVSSADPGGWQPPLRIERLALFGEGAAGNAAAGLWAFRPACFADLQVWACEPENRLLLRASDTVLPAEQTPAGPPPEIVDGWYLEDFGVVVCEPNGSLCLNRYLPAEVGQVRLSRSFATQEPGSVRFEFGFSDALLLEVDGEAVYTGENRYQDLNTYQSRGYVSPGFAAAELPLEAGQHHLQAHLGVVEPFGWGITLRGSGPGFNWLPIL